MQRSRVSNHPCHRLSVPSAKRFWCRHCMMVFEDAITRWRHSRSCRSGGFDNFVRRREIETQALQKMAETLDPDMVTPIAVPRADGVPGNKELCCFICRQRFLSLDEMREHVKYPCNKPAHLQRNPMPMVFPEPTFGTGIQQHYTDGPVFHTQQASSSASTSSPQAVTVYMNESEAEQQDSEAKPTNIYVNENGETVIEVENLDLNTKSGELSLAHLLTQLSQQGIVFDQHHQGETEVVTSHQEPSVAPESVPEVDYSQPTAVDAANTLTQLAGSAFRAVSNAQETYVPSMKHIKTEQVELQYQLEQQDHSQVQTYLQKEEPYAENTSEKYIICTNESDVIRVMHANDVSPEDSGSGIAFQNGEGGSSEEQNTLGEGAVEETILCQGQPDPSVQMAVLQEGENGASDVAVLQEGENGASEAGVTARHMMVLQPDQSHMVATPSGHVIKTESASNQVVIEVQNPSVVEQTELRVVEAGPVAAYISEERGDSVMEQIDMGQVAHESNKHCVVMTGGSEEVSSTQVSDSVVTSLLEMSSVGATARDPQPAAVISEPQSALLLPHIVSVSSAAQVPQVLLHPPHSSASD